jgi:hypothetical protein
MTGAEVLDLAENDDLSGLTLENINEIKTKKNTMKDCMASRMHTKLVEIQQRERQELRSLAASHFEFTYRPGSWRVNPIERSADNIKELLEQLVVGDGSIPYADALTLGLVNRASHSSSFNQPSSPSSSFFSDTRTNQIPGAGASGKQPTQPYHIHRRRTSLQVAAPSPTASRRKRIGSVGIDYMRNRASST